MREMVSFNEYVKVGLYANTKVTLIIKNYL